MTGKEEDEPADVAGKDEPPWQEACAQPDGGDDERWPELRKRLVDQLLPAERLAGMLRAAGAPAGPDEIELSRQALKDTYTRARMIRRRYTSLDLANEAGILDECVEELFAPGGFWAEAGR